MNTLEKLVLAILIVITLPITIPLAILAFAMALGILCFILGLIATYPIPSAAIAIVLFGIWYRSYQIKNKV